MLAALLFAQEFVIKTEDDFSKIRANLDGSFSISTDIQVTKDLQLTSAFKGLLDGRGHTITLPTSGSFFLSSEGAYFKNLIVVSKGAKFIGNAALSYFRNLTFDTQSMLFDYVSNGSFYTCKFSFGSKSVIGNSAATLFQGIYTIGKGSFVNFSRDDSFRKSFFNSSLTYLEEKLGYGAVSSIMNESAVISSKVLFAVDNSSGQSLNYLGGIASTSYIVYVDDVDVYANFSLHSMSHIGGMFGDMRGVGDVASYNVYIRNSSVAIDFNLDARQQGGYFYRGGVVGRNVEKDLTYYYITVYLKGKLVSPTEQEEVFGGLVGYNEGYGMYTGIYVLGTMDFHGCGTTAGGLLGSVASGYSSSKLEVTNSVVNVNFTGVISDDGNIAGLVGKSGLASEFTYCQTHGSLIFEIDYFEKGYIAFSGAIGYMSEDTTLTGVYSTFTMNVTSKNHTQVGYLFVAGLVADAQRGYITACAFSSTSIYIDNSFELINLGGVAAILDDTLNIFESWVYMRDVFVGECYNVREYDLGGIVGLNIWAVYIHDCFAQTVFDTPKTSTTYLSGAVGLSKHSRMNPDLERNMISITSSYKKSVPMVYSLSGLYVMHDNVYECTYWMNVNMSDPNCNTTAVRSSDVLTVLSKDLWEWNSSYYDLLPYLKKDIIRASNNSILLPIEYYYYNATYFYMDGGLVFPRTSSKFNRGASDSNATSPAHAQCNYNASLWCTDHAAQVLSSQFCVNNTDYQCRDNLLYCDNSHEFVRGVCSRTCYNSCQQGVCMNSHCVCDPQFRGSSCQAQSCSDSDDPCFGVTKCQDSKCICGESAQYLDFSTLYCIEGCPGLKHGICLGANSYVCYSGYTTAKVPCDACANGYNKMGGSCMSHSGYVGTVSGIVVGVILMCLIIAGVTWYFVSHAKKKQQGKLYSKLGGETVSPKVDKQDYGLGYEQF